MTQNQVNEYYDNCYDDYQLLWHAGKNFAFHYGFHDANHRHLDEAVVHMNSVLASLAKIKRTDTVLDAGCGIGGSSVWLAENIGCRVIGIDMNYNHVEIAKRLSKEKGVDSLVSFYTRDFCSTGLPANSLDVVWALESMCYADDKKAFLTETKRILNPGGTLVIADGFLNRPPNGDVKRWLDGWALTNLALGNLFHMGD